MKTFLINFIEAAIKEDQYNILRSHDWKISEECIIDGKLFRLHNFSFKRDWARVEYVGEEDERI